MNSIFDMFSIGVGPSSSHTVGPMNAAYTFVSELELEKVESVTIHLFGSLSLTGRGHGTDRAILCGLMGETAEKVANNVYQTCLESVATTQTLTLNHTKTIPFNLDHHIIWDKKFHPGHANTVTLSAFDKAMNCVAERTFHSIGGGFITEKDRPACPSKTPLYPFTRGQDLLDLCTEHNLTIADVVHKNESQWQDEATIQTQLEEIWGVMKEAIQRGISTEGELPGGLHVQRRAKDLYEQFSASPDSTPGLTTIIDHLSTYAIAVNEENAAGGKIVTAPTNGAAGVIPSVLYYVDQCIASVTYTELKTFFMTAGGICHLFKENASISGAEMGCQGEVGVASAMAAAGLTALKGGTPEQIECAAEIAMEHHLGLTCDPIKGLVQVPCIERNSMGAIKAVTACELALKRTQGFRKITLDKVIRTMKRTGEDMNRAYKETSLGGLAVEC